jgi:hypothetical protein
MTKTLLSVKQLSELLPAFTENSLRFHIFNAEPRINSQGDTVPGNGLASAIIRIGRKVLVDRDKFFEWIENQRSAS